MDYEEYKRKALEPIVNYIESAMASYSKEELEARIKEALPKRESEDERIRKELLNFLQKKRETSTYPTPSKKILSDWISWLEKHKEKTNQTQVEREYVRTLKSLIADFLRGKEEIVDKTYYQDIYDWLDGYHVEKKSAEVIIPKFRVGDIIEHNSNSKFYKPYTIVGFDRDGFNYLVDGGNIPSCSIGMEFIEQNYHLKEHKPAEWSEAQKSVEVIDIGTVDVGDKVKIHCKKDRR